MAIYGNGYWELVEGLAALLLVLATIINHDLPLLDIEPLSAIINHRNSVSPLLAISTTEN